MLARASATGWKRSSSWKSQLSRIIAWSPCFDFNTCQSKMKKHTTTLRKEKKIQIKQIKRKEKLNTLSMTGRRTSSREELLVLESVTKLRKNQRESSREASEVCERECEERRWIESWSFFGREVRREVIARASETETMDSRWGSDFHSNSSSPSILPSPSLQRTLLSIEKGFVSRFLFPAITGLTGTTSYCVMWWQVFIFSLGFSFFI